MIRVTLHALTDTFELDADPLCNVASLKMSVATKLGVHPMCQKLVLDVGTSQLVLRDTDLLRSHCPGGRSLCIALITSLDEVRENLLATRPAFRVAALQSLEMLALKAGDEVISWVCPCLADADHVVRCAAIKTLQAIAERGDQRVVNSACIMLLQTALGVEVRCTVLQALVMAASKGDQQVVSAVLSCLGEEAPCLRFAALQALVSVAEESDDRVAIAVRHCLRDPNVYVRCMAARASSVVLGNGEGVLALKACLDDPDWNVQNEVREALAKLRGARMVPGNLHNFEFELSSDDSL